MENAVYKYSFKCERMNDNSVPYNVAIKSDRDAVDVLRKIFKKECFDILLQEYIVVVFLNKANVPIGYYKASEGGTSSSIFDIKMIMKSALDSLCEGIILCHNHPSSNVNPSRADITETEKLKKACDFFGITLLDHIILGEHNSYSFATEITSNY